MNQTLLFSTVPQVIFFISFFVVFTLVELLLVWILNRLQTQYWEFVIDRIIRAKVRYGARIKIFALLILLALSFVITLKTPIVKSLQEGGIELRALAGLMLLAMIVIYFRTTKKVTQLAIEKRVHEFLYVVISVALMVYMILLADHSYKNYKAFVGDQLVTPTINEVGVALEEGKKKELLETFTAMAKEGKCPVTDLSAENGSLKHFVLVGLDPSLAEPDAPLATEDPQGFLKGRLCTNGKEYFMLSAQGAWYWVSLQD
jgi:hypothetical protein